MRYKGDGRSARGWYPTREATDDEIIDAMEADHLAWKKAMENPKPKPTMTWLDHFLATFKNPF